MSVCVVCDAFNHVTTILQHLAFVVCQNTNENMMLWWLSVFIAVAVVVECVHCGCCGG